MTAATADALAVPLVRERINLEPRTTVLFELGPSADVNAFVTELLRLGNDRISIRWLGETGTLIRVVDPPYYTLLAALDDTHFLDIRAYVERAPRLWAAVGFALKKEQHIDVPAGQIVLLRPPSDQRTLSDQPFHEIDAVLRIAAPLEDHRLTVVDSSIPIRIPMRLEGGGPIVQPTMWLIDRDPLEQVDAFVQSADSALLQRFLFAEVRRSDQSVIILKWRPGPPPPPELPFRGVPLGDYRRLSNFFVPVGCRVAPPLRRETLRTLLAPDASRITWLVPDANGETDCESIDDEAFRPLASWPDHIIARYMDAVTSWVRASEFVFAGALVEDAIGPRPQTPRTEPKAKPQKVEQDKSKHDRMPTPAKPYRPISVAPVPAPAGQPVGQTDLRQRLTQIEQQFLAIDGPLDHPDRQALWPAMAQLNAELRQPAESALAWAHSLWDIDLQTQDFLWGWVQAERALDKPVLDAAKLDRALAATAPTPADVRAVAAVTAWAAALEPLPPALRSRLPQIQAYFHAHDHLLPVRAMWLAWCGWCHAANGDVLALARARDRILERLLKHGLSSDVDLPAVLRFAGRNDSERLREVRQWVSDIRNRVHAWYESQYSDATSIGCTPAYIDLLFAFGMARLGEKTAARELIRQTETALADIGDETREAHSFLLQAFTWRVEEVLGGRPHGGPLPTELLDYLTQMHADAAKMPRTHELRRRCPYAVERLREQSRVLEPQERFDPYRHNNAPYEKNELIGEALLLPDVRQASILIRRINDLLRRTTGKPEIRVRVLAECVAVAGRLGSNEVSSLLEAVGPTLDASRPTGEVPAMSVRLRLLERSIFFAAHIDRGDLAADFIQRMLGLFDADEAAAALDESGSAIGQTLRSLRRLGLRDETYRILDRLEKRLLGGQPVATAAARLGRSWPGTLQNMLHVAAGWLFLDDANRAEPVMEAARHLLARSGRPGVDRVLPARYTQIICNYVTASGFGPVAAARDRIAGLFAEGFLDRLPNTFTTAPFYSWLHLNVAESVVLTLANDDFALGPIARRWLDEDEYVVRRRIHGDMRTALARGEDNV